MMHIGEVLFTAPREKAKAALPTDPTNANVFRLVSPPAPAPAPGSSKCIQHTHARLFSSALFQGPAALQAGLHLPLN